MNDQELRILKGPPLLEQVKELETKLAEMEGIDLNTVKLWNDDRDRMIVLEKKLAESEKLIIELKKKAQMNIHNSAFNGLTDDLIESERKLKVAVEALEYVHEKLSLSYYYFDPRVKKLSEALAEIGKI